ncbi:AMP-binding protein [Candidatus Woesearchaeota archaeon]|nr:AMP-binding protein [Candidatus Woesearchaeota archaeon]
MKKKVKAMLRGKKIKIMDIPYKGNSNPAREWHIFRNPLGMMLRGALNEVFKKLPPCEFKNHLYRIMGVKIGKNVTLSPDVHIDPLFPELVTIEDNVILGWGVTLPAHDINHDRLILGRIRVGKNAVIGGNVQVRLGTTIGRNAVVGARAFVNKDVGANEFAAGVPARFIKKLYPEIKYKNVDEFLKEKSEKLGSKTFIIYSEDDSKVSYKEFYDIVSKTANLFLSLGVKKGDKISAVIHDCKEFICILFGAARAGAVFNPINPDLTADELKYIINNAETKVLFVNDENLSKINRIKKELKTVKHLLTVNNYVNEIDNFSNKLGAVDVGLNDPVLLMYSSGTTGHPKGIILTQGNMLHEGYSLARALKFNKKTISMVSNPLFFSGGLFPAFMSAFSAGGTIVLNRKFSKSKFWQRIEKYRANSTYVVPTMLSILLNPPEDISKYDLKCLKWIGCGAAPLAIDLLKKFEETFNATIHDCYGLTENSAIVSVSPIDLNERRIGSIGLPLDINEIKIFDKDDNELPPGKEGEIVARGPNIFKEYLKLPDKTKETLKNGWLHTGDLGYKDKDGYLYISGRVKELIIRGGVNIGPREIDDILYKHEAVADAATIGVPHNIYGEEIASYVILKKEKKTTEKELIDFCKKYLAEFKCPKSIVFTDDIPKGPSGKLLRRMLVEDYTRRLK